MIVQRDKILQIYDNFKDLFQTYFGGDRIDFKHISTQMISNIDDWKLFFKIINLIIEKENMSQIKAYTKKEWKKMGRKINYSQNDGKTCSFCKKDLSQERNLIKSIAPGNILKDIYHLRCFDKKDTIKLKNKKKEKSNGKIICNNT